MAGAKKANKAIKESTVINVEDCKKLLFTIWSATLDKIETAGMVGS